MVFSGPASLHDFLRHYYNSQGMELCLGYLRDRGYQPGTIIDGGAYIGDWTRMVKKVFPQARVIMIEAQKDKLPRLADVQSDFPGTVEIIDCLLGPECRDAVPFFEMETGSSALQEMTDAPRKTVALQMRTLDDILSKKEIPDPIFLKLDVQGFEIEVLKGAMQTLEKTNLVLLEVALLPYNEGAPVLHEVIQCMKDHGFVAYDLCSPNRLGDNALFQVDIFFVREDSALRKSKSLTPSS